MEEYAPAIYRRYNKELETMLHCEEKELRKVFFLDVVVHFNFSRIFQF